MTDGEGGGGGGYDGGGYDGGGYDGGGYYGGGDYGGGGAAGSPYPSTTSEAFSGSSGDPPATSVPVDPATAPAGGSSFDSMFGSTPPTTGGGDSFFDQTLIPADATSTVGTLPPGLPPVQSLGGVSSTAPAASGASAADLSTADFSKWAGSAGSPAGGAVQQSATAAGAGAGAAGAVGMPSGSDAIDWTSMLRSGREWLGPLSSAAGLGYQVLKGQQATASTQAIQDQAAKIAQQGQQLSSQGQQILTDAQSRANPLIDQGSAYAGYLASGTLPPAMQAQVDQQARDAKTAIISRYASMGQSTDPTKNSTLQQELASVDDKARQQVATLGQQLLQGGTSLIGAGNQTGSPASASGLISTGASLSGMENSLLTTLSGIDQSQTAAIGKAIANFASALGTTNRTSNNQQTRPAT